MAGVPLKSLNGPSAGCCVGYTQSWVGPSKELYSVFPPIWLFPKVDRQLTTEGIYCCPVYKTLLRAGLLSTTGHSTNFVHPSSCPRWSRAPVSSTNTSRPSPVALDVYTKVIKKHPAAVVLHALNKQHKFMSYDGLFIQRKGTCKRQKSGPSLNTRKGRAPIL